MRSSKLTPIKLVKAHAYGNDFLLATTPLASSIDPAVFAAEVCDRHRGIGADGLMLVERTGAGARMRLFNADGSRSEVSGNGVRCVAAWLAVAAGSSTGSRVTIDTGAGPKPLELLSIDGKRLTFRSGMGHPTDMREVELTVAGERVRVVTLRVGNPQCVVLGPATGARLQTIGAALAVDPHFPEGTNVELADVIRPDTVRILIWERGVGPTESSGTGTCAAAVAAALYGGARRSLTVEAPGGAQHVDWNDQGLWLTGWAEVIADIDWRSA